MLIKPIFSETTQVNSFLLVQVYENNTLHDDLIGEAEIDMAPMFWDKMKQISCDVLDRSNKRAGKVILDLRLRSKFYTTDNDMAILATPNIKLCLTSLECTDLKNMRVSNPNDVLFQARWDNIASYESEILLNTGTKALFVPNGPGDMILSPAPNTTPQTSTIHLKVSDSSSLTGRKRIGEFYVNLSPLELDVEKEYTSEIFSKKGEKTGNVKFKVLATCKDIKVTVKEKKKIDQGSFFHNIMSTESMDNLKKTHVVVK